MSEKLDIQENNPFLTALRDCNLKISDAQILGNGHKDLMIPVPDESGKREFKKAQYFVKFPIELAEVLPGSTFSYEDFLSLLNKQGEVDEDKKLLLGKELGTYDKPQFKHEEDNFALKVFHGAGNECAMAISSLAQEVEDNGGFAQNPKLRGKYKRQLFKIVKPILIDDPEEKEFSMRIIEDCIASSDSIYGVLSLLALKTSLREDNHLNKIRIDVAVAATQGIAILRKFAHENNIDLQINVGYMANGLSRGIRVGDTDVYANSNYIIYPHEIKKALGIEFEYVVGDMGDALLKDEKGEESGGWEEYRIDNHGPDKREVEHEESQIYEDEPILVILANGGYAIEAYLQWIRKKQGKDISLCDYTELVIRASRVHSVDPELGYGVAISSVPRDILN